MEIRETLKKALEEGVVFVNFTKANGEVRKMKCTLADSMLPKEATEQSENTKTRKPNPDIQVVWDLEKNGWRSFRLDSVNEIEA